MNVARNALPSSTSGRRMRCCDCENLFCCSAVNSGKFSRGAPVRTAKFGQRKERSHWRYLFLINIADAAVARFSLPHTSLFLLHIKASKNARKFSNMRPCLATAQLLADCHACSKKEFARKMSFFSPPFPCPIYFAAGCVFHSTTSLSLPYCWCYHYIQISKANQS